MINISRFEIIPRKHRTKHLVPAIRRCSAEFKKQFAAGDKRGMEATSKAAWEAMTNLFEALRNEQDYGRLASSHMSRDTAFIVNNASSSEQSAMIAARRIDKTHSGYRPLSLRNTLNKIAHYDTGVATFRVDGRGSHYLVLGGTLGNSHWVAEILVSKLCKNAAVAVKAIV